MKRCLKNVCLTSQALILIAVIIMLSRSLINKKILITPSFQTRKLKYNANVLVLFSNDVYCCARRDALKSCQVGNICSR